MAATQERNCNHPKLGMCCTSNVDSKRNAFQHNAMTCFIYATMPSGTSRSRFTSVHIIERWRNRSRQSKKPSQSLAVRVFNNPNNYKSSLLEPTSKAKGHRRRSALHDGIKIEGTWTSDGIVDFGGQFQGELTVETLVLTKEGRIHGNIRAQIVTIEGNVDGTIVAQIVNIKTTATVRADIYTESISIDSGAEFEGRISCKGVLSDR